MFLTNVLVFQRLVYVFTSLRVWRYYNDITSYKELLTKYIIKQNMLLHFRSVLKSQNPLLCH